MAKEILAVVKLQCPGGKATPAPPVGPALGQYGVNIGAFVSQFNEKTRDKPGLTIPVEITIYNDRQKTFDLKFKSPPASVLLRLAAGAEKGSAQPHKVKIGKVSRDQVREIAKTKFEDLNAYNLDAACKIVEGTARSMGIEVS